MSNHVHSLIPSFVLGGPTRAAEWVLLARSYKTVNTGLLWTDQK